jgi:hypothetical protein
MPAYDVTPFLLTGGANAAANTAAINAALATYKWVSIDTHPSGAPWPIHAIFMTDDMVLEGKPSRTPLQKVTPPSGSHAAFIMTGDRNVIQGFDINWNGTVNDPGANLLYINNFSNQIVSPEMHNIRCAAAWGGIIDAGMGANPNRQIVRGRFSEIMLEAHRGRALLARDFFARNYFNKFEVIYNQTSHPTAVPAFYVSNAEGIFFDYCEVTGNPSNGLSLNRGMMIEYSAAVNINNCMFDACGSHGLEMNQVTYGVLQGNKSSICNGQGVRIIGGNTSMTNQNIWQNAGVGLVTSGAAVNVAGGSIYGNGGQGNIGSGTTLSGVRNSAGALYGSGLVVGPLAF